MPPRSMPAASEDAIRTRAYLMWEADGRPDGRAEHYWGLAAAEMTAFAAAAPQRAAASAGPAAAKQARPAKAKTAGKARKKG